MVITIRAVASHFMHNLVPSGLQVSPKHALLGKQGEDYYVTDLGSQHGTWLNDRKLRPKNPTQVSPSALVLGCAAELELLF